MKITNREQALQIALSAAPELYNKIIYKITDENHLTGTQVFPECWYITYSSLDKHCANSVMKQMLIVISKTTGEVKFKGYLQQH